MQSAQSSGRRSESLPTGGDRPPAPWKPSRIQRILFSGLILLHLLAVIGEPLRMFTQGRQPSAPDARVIRSTLGPYIDFAYLHHGYFFFAPNPGPSHLMDITLTDDDGSLRRLRLPDHRAQWPRLLYHRHFMLSEFLFQLYTPPPAPQDDQSELPMRNLWQRDRAMFERVRGSMEQHLAERYAARSASIQLMEHRLPNAIEVFDQQMPLNDERLYILLPDQAQAATDDVPSPDISPSPVGSPQDVAEPADVVEPANLADPGQQSQAPSSARVPPIDDKMLEEVKP